MKLSPLCKRREWAGENSWRWPGGQPFCQQTVDIGGTAQSGIVKFEDRLCWGQKADAKVYITDKNGQSLKGGKKSITRMSWSTFGSCCLATKSLGGVEKKEKDLNEAQTWLNEKLLEVNICLSHVFPVMFPNYKAASCRAPNMLASSNQRNWLSTSPQLLWWSNFALSHRRRS